MEIDKIKIFIGLSFLVLIGLLISGASIFVKGNFSGGIANNADDQKNKNEENIDKNSDIDNDGLPDRIEKSIGANFEKNDTDGDGYIDFEEIKNGYSPLAADPQGKLSQEEFAALKEILKNIDSVFYEKTFTVNITAASLDPIPENPVLSGPAVLKEEVSLSNKNWKYSFYAPADIDFNKEQVLLIGLHGFEGAAKDYIKFWQSDADKKGFLVAVLQAYPKTYPNGATVESYPWLEASDFTEAVLANIRKKYKIDEEKIFITGYSAGASSSYIVALDSGIKIRGVIPIDGYLPLEAGILDKLSKAKDANFYVVHGANDTDVKAVINQEKILLQYGAKMEFKTLKGIGHEYPVEEHENIVKWMTGLL